MLVSWVSMIANRVSLWNRSRKWDLFLAEVRPSLNTRVLDVGFQDLVFQDADNFIEEHYPWPCRLTALGIEEPIHFSHRYPEVEVVVYGGRDFPFEDRSFDVVWSNAVVEHVGDRDAQLHFIRECARVGDRLFLTTPNRGFPIEVHTRIPLLHWLPMNMFDHILRRIGKGAYADGYMNLLTVRQLRGLLNDAGLGDARIVKNRLLGPALDFVVIR